ncbi:MAG: hypothetical protein COB66_04630 [Coxiella sp. (in: Bacteria)]|nr:MAG: hypothetical protein COB66_04630 [Coxiella sp. (in: g-proteobacteria)]
MHRMRNLAMRQPKAPAKKSSDDLDKQTDEATKFSARFKLTPAAEERRKHAELLAEIAAKTQATVPHYFESFGDEDDYDPQTTSLPTSSQ